MRSGVASGQAVVRAGLIALSLAMTACGGAHPPVPGDATVQPSPGGDQNTPTTPNNPIGPGDSNPPSNGGGTVTNQAPSVPPNFSVMAVSDRTVTLMWEPSTDADGTIASYQIMNAANEIGRVNDTHLTVSNLQPGSNYSFQIRAVDDQGGVSAYSPRVGATTLAAVAADGASLYTSLGCAACHGADGQGVPEIAAGLTRSMTIAELTSVIDVTMPPGNEAACTASCAAALASYVFANFTTPPTTTVPGGGSAPVPVTGAALYTQTGCAACHGEDGMGTTLGSPLTRTLTAAQLTALIDETMPPSNPAACDAACSADLANYITANFAGKGAPLAVTDPFEGLPAGDGQIATVCSRLAAANANNRIRDAFCGATRPTITGLTQLQSAVGLGFANPNLVGRNNNGQGGNPSFALLGHSSSLVARYISAINPRAILFTPPNGRNRVPGFITMGFARGEQFVEMSVADRNTNVISYYLGVFEQACNATDSCTNGDLLTPAVESNWTAFTLYDETDLKNTIVDCLHCHQPNGPTTQKIQRMQELPNPWTHWFRDNRAGGIALFNDFRAAHGANEAYAGIPAALLNSGDPALLENLVRGNGFANQPNLFNSPTIENEVRTSNPQQPGNNAIPGVSATWNTLYQNATQGNAIPPPYHDVKVSDAAKLTAMTQAYQAFLAGNLAPSDLPDIREVFLDERAFEMGFAADPSLDGRGVLVQACAQCHNSRLDQTISRSRFNVNLDQMSDLNGGVLAGLARDQEIGTAINRLSLAIEDVKIMPPAKFFRRLTASDIAKVTQYLCTQVTNPIPQCVGQ